MAALSELSIGTRVRIYTGAPDEPRDGTVIAIQDEAENPGKVLGVELDQHHPLAHECDGLCADGHGWWTRPEYVAVLT